MIYLDNNATTPLDSRVRDTLFRSLSDFSGNPSSIHRLGQQARGKIIQSAAEIADCIGFSSSEIIFTSGATEALNAVIFGVASRKQKGHMITSVLEHSAVLQPLRKLEKMGFSVTYLTPQVGKGAILPEQILDSLRPDTCLIALMGANNETGVLTDLDSMAKIAQEREIPLIVDGVAWLGKTFSTVPKGVSAFCFSAHKIHGPTGIGVACVRKQLKWDPFILGGPQQNGRRGGTENLPGIIGCAAAVQWITQESFSSIDQMEKLRDYFEELVLKRYPKAIIHAATEKRICNTTNIAFPGIDGETLLMRLDLAGVAASHGSACASGALEPSHVLIGMGISQNLARSSLRFSLSKFTTKEDIERAIELMAKEFKVLMT